jgi:hypothetical protein
MKIYKYKDLRPEENRQHFIDMVLENSIWCADPDSLNDEDEFRFRYDYRPTEHTAHFLKEIFNRKVKLSRVSKSKLKEMINHWSTTKAKHVIKNGLLQGIAEPIVEDLSNKARSEIGIASFSKFRNKSVLWERYGGNRYGVCIEFEIPNNLIGYAYHNVSYVNEKVFHVDTWLESYLNSSKVYDSFRNMLLTKNRDKWKREAEIRLITSEQKIKQPVHGPVTEILFGGNVQNSVYEEMMKSISSHCQQNDIRVVRF